MSSREMYAMKQKAMGYYQENGIPQKMEEILNSMFYDQPNDVHGHLANFFEGFSKTPTITRLNAYEVLDSKGQPTIQTEVYCMIKNKEKRVTTSVASSENREPDHATQEERDLEDAERQSFVDRALEIVKGPFGEVLMGLDPTFQREADSRLRNVVEKMQTEEEECLAMERAENPDADLVKEGGSRPTSVASAKKGNKSAKGKPGKGGPAVVIIPDEPREKMLCGCNAVSAVSQAVCMTGAQVAGRTLYKHVAALKYNGQVPSKFCLPLPLVTILAGGRAFPGKSNCVKEFMVVPRPGLTFRESIKQMTGIYNSVGKILMSKGGVAARCVSDTGALCPLMDKPEVGLDLIQEAVTAQGLTLGQDVHMALNCAGQEIFDYEKGKYEVTSGQLKTAEDLVDFWAELLSRYPAIIALIDPMRKQEKEAWMKLCEKISDRCYIVGDSALHRPGILRRETLPEDFKTSGVVLRLVQMNSVSDVLEVATKMEEADNAIILSAGLGETPDNMLADLAVGAQARFLKLGAPSRGERVVKMNRLHQIEAELESEGQLGSHDPHIFPRLEPPPPPAEEDGEEGKQSEKPDSPAKKK